MCIIGLSMDDEWDLHAVVKSCAASTTASSTSENIPALTPQNESKMFFFPNVGEPSVATTTTISFGEQQPEIFGDTISFSINPVDSRQPIHSKTR